MTIRARGLHLLAYNIRPRLAGDRPGHYSLGIKLADSITPSLRRELL